MSLRRAPSVLQRLRGFLVGAPSRLWFLFEPYDGAADDEDFFSGGEGAHCVWYPLAGTLGSGQQSRWWRIAGPGAGIAGNLYRTSGHARFVPNPFWHRRGFHDWSREVYAETRDGRWVRLESRDGSAILRLRD